MIEKEVTNRLITLCKLILRQRKNPESSSGTNYRDLYRHYDDLLINFRLIKAILEFYIDQLDGTEVLTTPKFGNGTDSSKILSELLRDVLEGSPTYLSYAIQEYLFML